MIKHLDVCLQLQQGQQHTPNACAVKNPEVDCTAEQSSSDGLLFFQRNCWLEKMQLHFTKDVLPDSVSTDFQNLNKFSEQVNGPGFTSNWVCCSDG